MALRWWGLRAAAGQRPSQTTRPGSTSHDNDQINASNLERRPAGVRHSADEATKARSTEHMDNRNEIAKPRSVRALPPGSIHQTK